MLVRVDLLDREYKVAETVLAEPLHNQDFCDDCGRCVHCWPEGGCEYNNDGLHLWGIPPYEVDAFRPRIQSPDGR